jgi:hypothetical protein
MMMGIDDRPREIGRRHQGAEEIHSITLSAAS